MELVDMWLLMVRYFSRLYTKTASITAPDPHVTSLSPDSSVKSKALLFLVFHVARSSHNIDVLTRPIVWQWSRSICSIAEDRFQHVYLHLWPRHDSLQSDSLRRRVHYCGKKTPAASSVQHHLLRRPEGPPCWHPTCHGIVAKLHTCTFEVCEPGPSNIRPWQHRCATQSPTL